MSEYVSVAEAAHVLGVNRRTIWRLIQQGRLVAISNPLDHRAKLMRRDDVRWLAECTTDSTSIRAIQQPHHSGDHTRPYPKTIGIVADGSLPSHDLEAYMKEHWKPE
ncbi:MAG: helix-turn-helix transcriptional regulator [Chloroflexota bacterium]